MIITRTPLRISFLGGGTDYPNYFNKYGDGAVIGTAIDKYIGFSVSNFYGELYDKSIKISYSKIEYVNSIEDIQHIPFREILRKFGLTNNIEINCFAEVPSLTGLGSSGSFVTGLINSLYAYTKKRISPFDLAKEAIHFEREVLKEPVGYQDQTFAAFGGFNLIKFSKDGNISVTPIPISQNNMNEFENHLLLFFTGIKRRASDIITSQIKKVDHNSEKLKSIRQLVDKGYEILSKSTDFEKFGKLLNESWYIKKELDDSISNDKINKIYEAGMCAGAIGGKLLGAGGGGFMLFFVSPNKKQSVRDELRHLIEIPIKISNDGSKILSGFN